ncbi:hypothetical protein HDV00_012032 [Rhizophlyctis rosea]|nr:hypothetical protein HDV00_012032 [Rhizophlyctis rosea]
MLTGMVATILLRTLHKDIARYNNIGNEEGAYEEYGWKLVHADVFRPPSHPLVLSVAVGHGVQLFLMVGVTLLLAVLGFLSPANRGALSTVIIVFYFCFAGVAGYVAAQVFKTLGGTDHRALTLATAFALPGSIFLILTFLNFFLIASSSSAAVPLGTLFALITLWFLISVPLTILGSYFGFKNLAPTPPCKTNQIPRQIPAQPLYLNPYVTSAIGGVLCFGAVFIELYFIMNSIWFNRIYYVFGFLLLVFVILCITCSEVSLLMCYFQLCSEDYTHHHRSFLSSGSSGIYVFLYSIIYYFRKLQIDTLSSTVLYFGWSLVGSVLFGVLTGSVGYLSTQVFVRRIFGSVKCD